jgi:hypothetical protein
MPFHESTVAVQEVFARRVLKHDNIISPQRLGK